MIYQPATDESSAAATDRSAAQAPVGVLPEGLTLTERAAAALRAYLAAHGLDDYTVFHTCDSDLDDVDAFLPQLDARARWQPLPLLPDGHQPHARVTDGGPDRLDPPGVVHLPRHRVVLARWHMVNLEGASRDTLRLAAAPSSEAFRNLHQAVLDLRRSGQPVWQVFRTNYRQETRPRQRLEWSDLMLPDDVLARIEAELVGFFAEPVEVLYRSLDVPYRRGVLMHGPPGNGKTSIVRALGAALPDVPAILLRAGRGFDDDDLQAVFRKWTDHAPALLVIEDLDHMLKLVDLSQFLNLIDGIEGSLTGGLLLIATTNNPEQLDPALNNRPGRFDVVIEISCPVDDLRRRFFDKHAAEADEAARTELATATAGLSFAHLQEILRLAGLLAIHEGADRRTTEHLKRAAGMVHDTHRSAVHGFPILSGNPFGLAQFRRRG